MIDLGITYPGGDINVEVKAPYKAPPERTVWFGGGSALGALQSALDAANKQFPAGERNVLLVVPFTWAEVLSGRRPDFIRAFYGEDKIVFVIDKQTGRSVGEPETQFFAEGKFLKLWPKPRFTRVGAVVSLVERVHESGDGDEFVAEIRHAAFVVNNPHSPHPIPPELWGDLPQLVADGDTLRWSDGKKILSG